MPGRNQRISSTRERRQQHLLDVRVRSRKATQQRNRRALAWFSILLLTSAAIAGAAYGGREILRRYFWQNPDYNLAEIDVKTDGPLTRDQVLEAAGVHEGANIFTFDLNAMREQLQALPQVDHAEIARILPNKLRIEINERKPVAWLAARYDQDPTSTPGSFLLDKNGITMRLKTQLTDYLHLPVICGVPVENSEPGATVDTPEIRAALDLVRLTGDNPTHLQLRSIDVSKGYCMVVTNERHAQITFPLENLDAQLVRLAVLFDEVEQRHRGEIQAINLLVQRNVPVTFFGSGDIADDPEGAAAAIKPSPNSARGTKISAQKEEPVVKKAVPVKHPDTTKKTTPLHPAGEGAAVRKALPVSHTNSTDHHG